MSARRLAVALVASFASAGSALAQTAPVDAASLRAELERTRAALASANARSEAATRELAQTREMLRALEERVVRVERAQAGHASTDREGSDIQSLAETRGGRAGPGYPSTLPWEPVQEIPLEGVAPVGANGNAAAVSLQAGSGGGRASFTLGFADARGLPHPSGDGLTARDESFELSFSAPLADEGDTSFATLDSLASGTKLDLSWTIFQGRVQGRNFDQTDAVIADARRRCREQTPAYARGCIGLDDDFLDTFLTAEQRRVYEQRYADATLRRSWAFGLHAAVGYDEFSYFPFPDLIKTTEDRFSWEVGASATIFPRSIGGTTSALTFDASYQRGFEAARTETACPVSTVPETVRCVTGALAAPAEEENLLLSVSLRQPLYFGRSGLLRSVGIAPRFEFDALSDDYAIDVPIYLVPNSDGNLIGGIRFGYTSEEDDFIAGIFVGARFSVFGAE